MSSFERFLSSAWNSISMCRITISMLGILGSEPTPLQVLTSLECVILVYARAARRVPKESVCALRSYAVTFIKRATP
jgi:hypothetical protein